jgi:hypothetical protein
MPGCVGDTVLIPQTHKSIYRIDIGMKDRLAEKYLGRYSRIISRKRESYLVVIFDVRLPILARLRGERRHHGY